MKAKKVLALFVAAAMTMSLAACGNDEAGSGNVQQSSPEQTTESTQESSSEVAPESSEEPGDTAPVEAGPASIDFEDGLFGFTGDNTAVVGGIGNAASYNVVDFSGSKALEVVPNGKGVGIGFQIDALLGDKVSQVKTIELSIGTKSSDGNFYACSGKLYGMFAGEKDSDPWSVYLETANPKTATYEVPDGKTFGEGDNFVVSLETDNANSEGAGWQTLYIDNVTFKDASGNVIEADSSAEYVAVESGADPNLMVLKDVVELEGFACSAGGWSQSGIELTDEQKALFVPGCIVEIEYSSDAPVWLIAKGSDDNPNPKGNWLRAVNQEGDNAFIVDGAVADGKVQYTYEQLAAYWGDDFVEYLTAIDAESSADWEVYSVKVGSKAWQPAHNIVALDGFACSAGGWAQAGIELTEEQVALFKPGCVVNIEYAADSPVWLIAKANDDNPNPNGNWLRAVNQDTFIVDGYVSADNSKVQYTYEQLAAYWGEDCMDYTVAIDAESSADWEVYSVKIGTDSGFVTLGSAVELEGFACSAGGWSQSGIELTDEQKALFVPGCIVEIEYSSDAPVWLIAKGSDDNPNPKGNWLRAVNQEGDNAFIVDGAVADGKVQYTYEQLAAYWGDDFVEYLTAIDAESSADWEVYSVKVGSKAWQPAHNIVALDGFACSAGGWAQAGIELTEEQVALFKPGCVVNIEYAADSPVWLIAKANDDNPNPLGNWLRGVEQEGFIVDGAVLDGKVQYTYETLAGFWGEDFTDYTIAIDAESSADWEVYSVSVGQTE